MNRYVHAPAHTNAHIHTHTPVAHQAARRGKLLLSVLNDFAADFAATVEGTDLKRSPAPPPMSDGLRQPMGAQRSALEAAREQADTEDALRELRGGARIAFILEDLFCKVCLFAVVVRC